MTMLAYQLFLIHAQPRQMPGRNFLVQDRRVQMQWRESTRLSASFNSSTVDASASLSSGKGTGEAEEADRFQSCDWQSIFGNGAFVSSGPTFPHRECCRPFSYAPNVFLDSFPKLLNYFR